MQNPVVYEVQAYYPVNPVRAYGRPETAWDPELSRAGAKRHFVKGDGSCWARATWMCVLSQILDDPQKFDQFVRRVGESPQSLGVPVGLAGKVQLILEQLRAMSWDERYVLLNHENVDRDLVFFMRRVAGEMMARHASIYTQKDIEGIKRDIHRFGGPESTFFARYFEVELHLVTKRGNRWVYQMKEAGKNYYEHPVELRSANIGGRMCLFGVSDAHFEFLSF